MIIYNIGVYSVLLFYFCVEMRTEHLQCAKYIYQVANWYI